jgi:hypothetical protein
VLIFFTWLLVIPFSILWYKIFELHGIALGKGIVQKINFCDAVTFEPERSREVHRVGRFQFAAAIGRRMFQKPKPDIRCPAFFNGLGANSSLTLCAA